MTLFKNFPDKPPEKKLLFTFSPHDDDSQCFICKKYNEYVGVPKTGRPLRRKSKHYEDKEKVQRPCMSNIPSLKDSPKFKSLSEGQQVSSTSRQGTIHSWKQLNYSAPHSNEDEAPTKLEPDQDKLITEEENDILTTACSKCNRMLDPKDAEAHIKNCSEEERK